MAKKTVKAVKTNGKPAAKSTSKKAAAVKPAAKKAAVKKTAAKKVAPVGARKLTPEFVSKIKQALKKGASQTALAEKTKLPRSTIYNIAAGNTWKDVK